MKKRFLRIFAVAALSVSITACNSGNIDKINNENQTEKTKISWWAFPTFAQENGNDPTGTYEQSLIDEFENRNQDIEVELKMIDFTTGPEKIAVALQNDKMGDVLFDAPGRIIDYGKKGYLVSLSDMFDDKFEEDIKSDSLIQACKASDVPYMYPLSSTPFYMAFNKAYLEDAGVADKVKNGWSTDDFKQVLESLKAKNYVAGSVFCLDQGGDQATRALVANLFSSSITDRDLTRYTINDAAGIEGLEFIQNAVEKGLMQNGTYENGSSDIQNFINGNTSFTILWSLGQQSINSDVLKKNNIETVSVPFPSDDGMVELEYLINGFCIFNHNDDARTTASKKFIQFLCDDSEYGPKNVVQTGALPVRTSFGNLYSDPDSANIMTWTGYYGVYYNTIDGFSSMRTYWYEMIHKIIGNYETPKDAANEFVRKANETIG